MSSTTTRNQIGQEDISWQDGLDETFDRRTSTGGLLTLTKVGSEIDLLTAWSGDLVRAINKLGSSKQTIYLRSGAYSLSTDLTVPSNVILRFGVGAIITVATGKTLTINGHIDAGPYQIFDWGGTGAIVISGSPTQMVYLNWWGAVPNATAGSGAECSAKIQKAYAGMGHHQTLKLSPGWYTVNHFSLTDANMMYNMEGSGKIGYYGYPGDGLWITGASSTDGIVFGQANTAMQAVKLKNLSIGGAASCCKNGLYIYMSAAEIHNVNLWMGATEYGMVLQGCIANDLKVGGYHQDAANEAGPAGVLKLTYDPSSAWACNYTNVDIRCNQTGGSFTLSPLYIKGVRSVSGNQPAGTIMHITGIIDQVDADYAFEIINGVLINIDDLYCETTVDLLLDGCNSININSLLNTEGKLIISNSNSITLNGYNLKGIDILPDCSCVVVGPGEMLLSGVLNDYAGDTIFLNGPAYNPIYSVDCNNYIHNANLIRWDDTNGMADGGGPPLTVGWYKYTTTTWTQCTGTQGDGTTTAPGCTYYVKTVVTDPGDHLPPGNRYNLSSEQVAKFLGKTLTFSYWQNYPTGQTLIDALLGSIDITVPARANSTAYDIGDAVTSGGNTYLCVGVTGNQQSAGSPPTFDTNGGTTTDNNVTWRSFYWLTLASIYDNPPATSDGKWRHVKVSQYIPLNTTAISVNIAQPLHTNYGDSTMYFGGPALMLGRQTQRMPVANNPLRVEVGPNVIWAAVPAANTWIEVGDLDLATGKRCTVAGPQGTATWANFP